MTFPEFDKVSDEIIAQMIEMRNTKGKEYAGPGDRFDNFSRLAQRLQIPRNKVLWTYTVKHLDAIESYINNQREFSTERIEGRIVDAMTYLMLLAGMIREDKAPTSIGSFIQEKFEREHKEQILNTCGISAKAEAGVQKSDRFEDNLDLTSIPFLSKAVSSDFDGLRVFKLAPIDVRRWQQAEASDAKNRL